MSLRLGVAVTLGAAIALVVSGAASADTLIKETGHVGVHYLTDDAYHAGATCKYAFEGDLLRIGVRPPVVYARNTTGGTDSQTVGWRFRIDRLTSSGVSLYYRSPIQKAQARDVSSASFSGMHFDFSKSYSYDNTFRVRVITSWYRNGSLEGKAVNEVDYFRYYEPVSGYDAILNRPGCRGQEP